MTTDPATPPSPTATGPAGPTLGYAVPGTAHVYAGFTLRLFAWIIDLAVLTCIRLALLVVFGMIAYYVDEAGRATDTARGVASLSFIAGLYLCAWPYYALMESSAGQGTLGKRAMGIRVEDVDGGTATFTQTTVRFFLRLVSILTLGFGFLMIAVTRRRQAMHDLAANTIVTVTPRSVHAFPQGYVSAPVE
jgi:uncharacterized RDD family membrane protein YckC